MKITDLKPANILAKKSNFYLDFLFNDIDQKNNKEQSLLEDSIKTIGILTPLIVWQDISKQLHIISGFKRFSIAKKLCLKSIPCQTLKTNTPTLDIIKILLTENQKQITESFIKKTHFISFLTKLKIASQQIIELLPSLELSPHINILNQCQQIQKLPKLILQFCQNKQLNQKQCLKLTHYPTPVITYITSLQTKINLTNSIYFELIENLNDYLRCQDLDITIFQKKPQLKEILKTNKTPNELTPIFRSYIKQKKLPTITSHNKNIETIIKELKLPTNIKISWDKTLEKNELDILINLKSTTDLSKALKNLSKNEIPPRIQDILDNL
jgi:hypothetical protein